MADRMERTKSKSDERTVQKERFVEFAANMSSSRPRSKCLADKRELSICFKDESVMSDATKAARIREGRN
jgi:hypothetical protein